MSAEDIVAAYKATEEKARQESQRFYALAAKRFEENNLPLSRLSFRRALRMEALAEEMRVAAVLLRAEFGLW